MKRTCQECSVVDRFFQESHGTSAHLRQIGPDADLVYEDMGLTQCRFLLPRMMWWLARLEDGIVGAGELGRCRRDSCVGLCIQWPKKRLDFLFGLAGHVDDTVGSARSRARDSFVAGNMSYVRTTCHPNRTYMYTSACGMFAGIVAPPPRSRPLYVVGISWKWAAHLLLLHRLPRTGPRSIDEGLLRVGVRIRTAVVLSCS